ncbi:MAG: hypothetical protein DMG76_25655 [Acidobacteria bacterium]|nr:MAG: hypothetical protein DMG76_25655 [Acidobacteriota bacterium]
MRGFFIIVLPVPVDRIFFMATKVSVERLFPTDRQHNHRPGSRIHFVVAAKATYERPQSSSTNFENLSQIAEVM